MDPASPSITLTTPVEGSTGKVKRRGNKKEGKSVKSWKVKIYERKFEYQSSFSKVFYEPKKYDIPIFNAPVKPPGRTIQYSSPESLINSSCLFLSSNIFFIAVAIKILKKKGA